MYIVCTSDFAHSKSGRYSVLIRNDRAIVITSINPASFRSINRFYESSKLKNWTCDYARFS